MNYATPVLPLKKAGYIPGDFIQTIITPNTKGTILYFYSAPDLCELCVAFVIVVVKYPVTHFIAELPADFCNSPYLSNMFVKRLLGVIAFSLLALSSYAQGADFCEAVSAILRDAPNQFKNTRTKVMTTTAGSTTYKCGIPVPGTINSRVVASMGVFYEGAVYQSKTTVGLKEHYDHYKKLLSDCLVPKGFSVRSGDNFYPGLVDFKKVMFMPVSEDGKGYRKGVGHASMEVDYNKQSGLYTLIFYIFEQ